MQLVDERTTWLDTMRDRRCGPAEVRERFGVEPARVPDVLGLMGDAIDNIPGVKGIGEKTASVLVRELGPVEDILARLPDVERLAIRGAKKVRETAARLEALAVAGPTGPVTLVAAPEAPPAVAALAPLLGDLGVTKIGGDLKALRVALARRGVALAGPGFDLSLASYCLNPSRAEHGIAGLAEEYLGLARRDGAG